MLFLAASLADVAEDWQAEHGSFDYHTGASLLLTQQIRAGAHADLFLAAGPAALTPLQEEGRLALVDSAFLHNRLVLVTSPGVAPPEDLAQLLEPRFARIAVPDPDLSPAGGYAREGLKKAGLWERLLPRLLFTGDVRMAAETVRLATADLAFVYATEAASLKLPAVALDSTLFPVARYPLAMLAPRDARKDSLWVFLHSARAYQIAVARGFK